jgi:DNA topoisomerase-1
MTGEPSESGAAENTTPASRRGGGRRIRAPRAVKAAGKNGPARATNGGSRTLLIVESPAKATTIQKYLGDGYAVAASMGHLIDLPKSRLAINVEAGFEPEYITVRGKAKILKDLKQRAQKSEAVLLASDNDREGEAISYHIRNELLRNKPGLPIGRIVFNEITPRAIREAIGRAADIDMRKVNAQKARRVLDRLVGYELSPLLWSKVKNGLSAGRVQSVALRLICEREREVEHFIPEEYWTLDVELRKGKQTFRATLTEWKGVRPQIRSEAEAHSLVQALQPETAMVADVRDLEKVLRPRPPFTTSTLQQTAANRLGFTSRRTMQVAQRLYEGVSIGNEQVGLISYMRTDSTRVSTAALEEVRKLIGERYPDALPETAVEYAMGKGAQDAHEAIRPTYVEKTPDSLKEHLGKDELRLYGIIWERFVSSQMSPARTRTTTYDIRMGDGLFRASTTRTLEPGFQRALKVLAAREGGKRLPVLQRDEVVPFEGLHPEQHFTSGPARYTDATIVKELEEKGIGRPSTYAPIISVLLDRYYVLRKSRQLVPTTLGRIISDILSRSFPDVLDVGFTAAMEKRLDEIEESGAPWDGMLREFYAPFKKQVEYVMETLESVKGALDEPTDQVCETCGRPMVKKLGRFGFFLACTGFPECRTTRPVPLADCPRPGCTGKIVARRKQGGRGKEFYGCTNYPACDFVSHFKPSNTICPRCGKFLVEKEDRQRGSYKACINPECDYLHTHDLEDPAGGPVPGQPGSVAAQGDEPGQDADA